jgi:hypothetical protein
MWWGARTDCFTIHSGQTVPLRVHLKACAPCVHSFKTASRLYAQLQDCGTPASTAKAAASLHASLKTAKPLRVQQIKCSYTSACCCNLLKTAKRQLHPCGHNFKTTATLCAKFQDSCNPMRTVSRQLHPCGHSFITAEPLRLQLRVSYRWYREVYSAVRGGFRTPCCTEMLWYNCPSVSDLTKPTCASAFLIRPYT